MASLGRRKQCFNSSVGILSVGTIERAAASVVVSRFQFLSRNSVRWDREALARYAALAPVSIPQSEFCPLGRRHSGPSGSTKHLVSIPQSEFCPLGLTPLSPTNKSAIVSIPQSEFCPLGRGFVPLMEFKFIQFQFLSRNSVRWDVRSVVTLLGE